MNSSYIRSKKINLLITIFNPVRITDKIHPYDTLI